MTITSHPLNSNRLAALLFATIVLAGCSDSSPGNVYVENRSSSDIVIQFPPGSKPSAVIPAHSRKLALTNVMLGAVKTYTDIWDARTHKLLVKGSEDLTDESRFYEGHDLHIIYHPPGSTMEGLYHHRK